MQLKPNLDLKTKAISTTAYVKVNIQLHLPKCLILRFGAKIIDTPGIKGFGVVDMDKEEVGDYFPEFFALKQDCKFNNCLHLEEPKCAIKLALDRDEISYSRYRSYVQILEGEEEHYRTDNWDNE